MKKSKTNSGIVFPDIHYPKHDKHSLDVAEQILEWLKPTTIVYLGDNMDMTPVSHWVLDKKRVVEGKRLLKEYNGMNKLLDKHMKLAGKQVKDVVYMEGNHENWVEQYLDKHPEVEGMLEVPTNLHLDDRSKGKTKWHWVKYNDFYKIGKLYFTHGMYTNKYHSFKHVDMIGKNVIYGHCHDIQLYTKCSPIDETQKHQAMSIGCLCKMSPDYMKGKPNNWVNAVGIFHILPNGNFNFYTVNITNGVAVMPDGKIIKSRLKK